MKFFSTFLFCLLTSFTLQSATQKLIIIRHGEADNNVNKVYNSSPANPNYAPANLTEDGKAKVEKTAKALLAQGFDDNNIAVVLMAPLPRTVQTADILVESGLVSKDKILTDKRITETNAGDLEGKPMLPEWTDALAKKYHAESPEEVRARMQQFYDAISHEYSHGNIIVITHLLPAKELIEVATQQPAPTIEPGEAKIIPLRAN